MQMFKDLFEGSTQSAPQLQLSSAFDAQEFSAYLGEADSTIDTLIQSYRGLMTEALQESAGSVDDNVIMVLEQANDHVGNKIVAALKRLWEWIVKIVDSAVNFIATLLTSNKKFIEKIKPEVEKKNLSAQDMAKITMTSYDYKPDVINIDNVKTVLSDIEAEARTEYNAQNKDKLDQIVQKYNEDKRAAIDFEKIDIANRLTRVNISETKDWGKYKDALRLALLGGGKKTTKTFSMDYFKVIENYSANAGNIKSIMEKTKGEFKKLVDYLSQKAQYAKKEGSGGDGANAKFASGKIAYLNYLRKRTSAIADVFAELLSLKLNTLKRQLSEARAFCMYAARYKKPVNESAAVIPFDPLFENIEDVEDDDEDQIGESANGFVF